MHKGTLRCKIQLVVSIQYFRKGKKMLTVFSNQERVSNDAFKLELAKYVADYVMEEQSEGNLEVDKWMISDAFDAFLGGAK